MMLSFTSHFTNTEIQKEFFAELVKHNIEVTINTNVVEDNSYEEVL